MEPPAERAGGQGGREGEHPEEVDDRRVVVGGEKRHGRRRNEEPGLQLERDENRRIARSELSVEPLERCVEHAPIVPKRRDGTASDRPPGVGRCHDSGTGTQAPDAMPRTKNRDPRPLGPIHLRDRGPLAADRGWRRCRPLQPLGPRRRRAAIALLAVVVIAIVAGSGSEPRGGDDGIADRGGRAALGHQRSPVRRGARLLDRPARQLAPHQAPRGRQLRRAPPTTASAWRPSGSTATRSSTSTSSSTSRSPASKGSARTRRVSDRVEGSSLETSIAVLEADVPRRRRPRRPLPGDPARRRPLPLLPGDLDRRGAPRASSPTPSCSAPASARTSRPSGDR